MSERTGNHKRRSGDCGCGGHASKEAFDAEVAFRRLSKKFDDLAQLLAAEASQAPLSANTRSLAPQADAPQTMSEALARIVGGIPVVPGTFPECALIGRKNQNGTFSWFCTGVLIAPRIVVTAGHCFDPNQPANVVALRADAQTQLQNAEILSARRMVQHPQYPTTHLHDISVMILRTASKVTPVRVATTAELGAALKTTLVGFGNDDVLSTRGFGVKRQVTVPITHTARPGAPPLDDAEQEFGFESDLEFVAGGLGFDSCNGDSGGPAYIDVGGERVVAGLTSRATETARNPCGEGGIYTRLDVHLDFIKSVAKDAHVQF